MVTQVTQIKVCAADADYCLRSCLGDVFLVVVEARVVYVAVLGRGEASSAVMLLLYNSAFLQEKKVKDTG